MLASYLQPRCALRRTLFRGRGNNPSVLPLDLSFAIRPAEQHRVVRFRRCRRASRISTLPAMPLRSVSRDSGVVWHLGGGVASRPTDRRRRARQRQHWSAGGPPGAWSASFTAAVRRASRRISYTDCHYAPRALCPESHRGNQSADNGTRRLCGLPEYSPIQSCDANHHRRVAHRTPAACGASVRLPAPGPGLLIRLPYRPPFHWPRLLAFLASRAVEGVELVRPGIYRRTIEIGAVVGVMEVRQDAGEHQLLVNLELPSYESLMEVVERVRRMFDLAADPFQIAEHLSRDSTLRCLLADQPGLRVPGIWDGFEAAVRAILGERLPDGAPKAALARLVRTFGRAVKTSTAGLTHVFPGPQDLAGANLASVGIRTEHASSITALARAVMNQDLRFEASMNLEDAIARLQVVRGISRPMAEYIAMRAFGEPDAFPVPAGQVPQNAAAWRPWRAYAAIYLWSA